MPRRLVLHLKGAALGPNQGEE
jgi:hypothetical protein